MSVWLFIIPAYLIGYMCSFLFLLYHVKNIGNGIEKWDWIVISILSVLSFPGFLVWVILVLLPKPKIPTD